MNLMSARSSISVGVFIVTAILCAGCKREDSTQREPSTHTTPTTGVSTSPKEEITVLADGSLLVESRPSTLTEIDQRLGALAKSKGCVWYYREAGSPQAESAGMEVIKLVVKYRLPIRLSTKPDFSDTVGPSGVPHAGRNGQ